MVAAGILYALALLIFLSPVTTDVARQGEVQPESGFVRICGLTVTQAWPTVEPVAADRDQISAADCIDSARRRVGYGVLLLLLALAPLSVAALTPPPHPGTPASTA